jgi:hypothetical protein
VGFALSADEAVAVTETVTAFVDVLPERSRAAYEQLAADAAAGEIADELVPALERVCALALETGKARSLGRAEGERLLTAVYRRTPGGSALTAETTEVNRMLAELAGRTLESARLSMRMPGRYLLDLSVDGVALQIAIEPEGLEVRSLQAG